MKSRITLIFAMCVFYSISAMAQNDRPRGLDRDTKSTQTRETPDPQKSPIYGGSVYVQFGYRESGIELRDCVDEASAWKLMRDMLRPYKVTFTSAKEAAFVVNGPIWARLGRQDMRGGNVNAQVNIGRQKGILGQVLNVLLPNGRIPFSAASSHNKWTINAGYDLAFRSNGLNGPEDEMFRLSGETDWQGIEASDKRIAFAFAHHFLAADMNSYESSRQEEWYLAKAALANAFDQPRADITIQIEKPVTSFPTEIIGLQLLASTVDADMIGYVHKGQRLSLSIPRFVGGKAVGGARVGRAIVMEKSGRVVTLQIVEYQGPTVPIGAAPFEIEVPR